MGRNSIIDELIDKVIYNTYDQRIRQFLLKIAVLDSFTAEQALFVTQENKANEFLKKLCRQNAFIKYDEVLEFYKIHNVLLDFIRVKQQGYSELTMLYKRAGDWYVKKEEYISAYEYFYRAGETEYILSLLNSVGTVTNGHAQFYGSFKLFESVSRELLFKYPIAYLQYISLLLLSGNAKAAENGAKRLNELEKYYENAENIYPNLKKYMLAEICIIRIFAVFNDAEKMIECSNKALDLIEGGQSCLIKRNSPFTFGSPHFLYSYFKQPGFLKQTVKTVAAGFPSFALCSDGCGTGCEYVVLAEYALETGDRKSVELNAFKAKYKAKTKEQTGIVICAVFTLIRLYILEGKTSEGLALLRELREDVAKENDAIYNTTLDLCEGYIYGCLGQLSNIPLWLQTGEMSPASFLYQGMAFNYIVYGKAVLLSKNYIELEMLTEIFPQYFSILGNRLGFLHNQILNAAAKFRLYGSAEGCAAMYKALEMGQEDDIILPFAEYSPDIIEMVRHIAGRNTEDKYIKAVYRCCRQYLSNLKKLPGSMVSLSPREKEVLILTSEGLKRHEIAQRLMISDSTVKTHLENIYRKLKVRGKTEAIKKVALLKIV